MTTLLEKLLSARWFSRAWCTHEFRVSRWHLDDFQRQLRFLIMDEHENVITLFGFSFSKLFLMCQRRMSSKTFEIYQRLATPSTIQIKTRANDSGIPHFAGQSSFVQQLHDTIDLGCFLVRDKLQIALNISGKSRFFGSLLALHSPQWLSSRKD